MADQHNNQQLSGQQSNAGNEWTHCAAGTLGAFASKERFRRLRRRTLSIGGVVATCCVLLLAASYLPGLNERSAPGGTADPLNSVGAFPPYGGLSCRDVIHDLEPFFAGSIAENRHGRIRQHLDDCPACNRIYQDAAKSRGVPIAGRKTTEPAHDTSDSNLSFALATR